MMLYLHCVSVCLSVSFSLPVFVCLSLSLSPFVCVSSCLFPYLVFVSVSAFLFLSVSLLFFCFFCVSFPLFVCLCVCLFSPSCLHIDVWLSGDPTPFPTTPILPPSPTHYSSYFVRPYFSTPTPQVKNPTNQPTNQPNKKEKEKRRWSVVFRINFQLWISWVVVVFKVGGLSQGSEVGGSFHTKEFMKQTSSSP